MTDKKEKKSIGFQIGYPFLWLAGHLPLWVLYRLSDFLFVIMLIVGYRRKVVTRNLRNSFPYKTSAQIRRIRIRFYRHFCDLLVETISLIGIDIRQIQNRVKVVNPELMEELLNEGNNVIAVLGHYCNWEWTPVVSMDYKNTVSMSVYRPLKNKEFDKLMLNMRSRFGSINLPLNSVSREIVKLRQQSRQFVIGLISDQSPSKFELNYWTTFLNQNTAIILGPEKMARLSKSKVVYWHIVKTGRGRYQMTYIPYPGDVTTSTEYEITEWHVRLLEGQIMDAPEFWLWSHKRWKYSHLYKPSGL